MGALEFSIKTIEDAQQSDKENALDVFLKYEHISAVEGAPVGSSKDTHGFEVEIKGALEVKNWVALEDSHGSGLVSWKEFTKQLNERWNRGRIICCTRRYT